MNERDILKAMNGVDERYYSEYRSFKRKRKIKVSRTMKIGAAIAAAVAMLTIPAGAYVYNQLLHKDNVEYYLSGSDRIEQNPSAVKNHVMENDDYRLTIDAQLSDGHNVMMIMTHESKSLRGMKIKASSPCLPESLIQYADGSAGPFTHQYLQGDMDLPMVDHSRGGYASDTKNSIGPGFDRSVGIFRCDGIDIEKDIKISFFADIDDHMGAQEYYWQQDPVLCEYLDGEIDFEITNELDGFEFVTNFSPNVECVPLYSDEGAEIYLSEFEIYTEDERLSAVNFAVCSAELYFISNDGEKIPLDLRRQNFCGYRDYFVFGEIIDVNDYAGIELYGVKYLKTE